VYVRRELEAAVRAHWNWQALWRCFLAESFSRRQGATFGPSLTLTDSALAQSTKIKTTSPPKVIWEEPRRKVPLSYNGTPQIHPIVQVGNLGVISPVREAEHFSFIVGGIGQHSVTYI